MSQDGTVRPRLILGAMEQKRPRWVDKPELDWTPETPLRLEPLAARENPVDPGLEPLIVDPPFSGPWSDPWVAATRPKPANDPLPARPAFGRDWPWASVRA